MGSTRLEVLKKIDECERRREFDRHVDPVNYDIVLPTDENYPYIDKDRPFWLRLRYFLENIFIIRPFCFYQNKFVLKTKVIGKENLKSVDTAILTCNHVNMWDCLTVIRTMRQTHHKLYITAAYFNNFKGFLGEMMRASNLMPLSQNQKGMKKFINSIDSLLKGKNYIMFYPEQAMWWNYEKPRPYKDGAFHFAVQNNVPIIPMFITFNKLNKLDKEGIPKKQFNLNIMEPIYPKPELSKKENIEYLKNQNFEMCRNKYEEFYKRKLEYLESE